MRNTVNCEPDGGFKRITPGRLKKKYATWLAQFGNKFCLTGLALSRLVTDKPVALGFWTKLEVRDLLIFDERGTPKYLEKNVLGASREPTTNSTHMTSELSGIESRTHWWGALNTAPTLHPSGQCTCSSVGRVPACRTGDSWFKS